MTDEQRYSPAVILRPEFSCVGGVLWPVLVNLSVLEVGVLEADLEDAGVLSELSESVHLE